MIYIATKGELRQFSGIPVLYLSHSSLDFTAHCLIREDVETHLFFFPLLGFLWLVCKRRLQLLTAAHLRKNSLLQVSEMDGPWLVMVFS